MKPWWSGSWSSGQAEEAVVGQGLGGQERHCGSPECVTGGACLAGVCSDVGWRSVAMLGY